MFFSQILFFVLVFLSWNEVYGKRCRKVELDEALTLDGRPDGEDSDCSVCGISGSKAAGRLSKVINGSPVKPFNKYPWIIPMISKGSRVFSCGGAVISKTFVLTAAHCVRKYTSPSDLSLGLMDGKSLKPAKMLSIEEIIMHPDFSPAKMTNDIALLRVKEPFQCSKSLRPICLPQKNMDRIGSPVIISGYGRWSQNPGTPIGQQRLLEGRVRQVKPSVCQKSNAKEKNKEKIFCTLGSGNQSSCKGDSGTSVFGDYNGVFYSLGVTSIHTDGKTCPIDKPVTFSNTYGFRDWIESHVKDLPSPPK